jgi:hypothetical protein
MTTFVIIVASSALPVALSQQHPGVNAKKRPPAITEGPQDPQFQRLEGMAMGCGPEFAVDGLLKVAVLASSQNPKWRARVIEESFVLAGRATVAYATSPLSRGVHGHGSGDDGSFVTASNRSFVTSAPGCTRYARTRPGPSPGTL